MIDLHAHLLPGIDDGPPDIKGAIAMARVAWESGTRTVVCTPHHSDRYPTRPTLVHEAVAGLQEELVRHEIPLQVLPGMEIAVSRIAELDEDDLAAATLGGRGRWLLVELPFRGWPLQLPAILGDLEIRGFGAVLAHPERSESVQLTPDRLRDLVGRGALLQLTADSFAGEHGHRARRAAQTLIRGGLAHFLASDAHSADWRPPDLREGVAHAAAALKVAPASLSWMVEAGPREILDGGRVRPPRLAPIRTRRGVERPARPAGRPPHRR